MALRLISSRRGERRNGPKPFPEICPVCEGRMEIVYARNNQQVCACVDCRTGITVPASAWERLRDKQARQTPAPPERDL